MEELINDELKNLVITPIDIPISKFKHVFLDYIRTCKLDRNCKVLLPVDYDTDGLVSVILMRKLLEHLNIAYEIYVYNSKTHSFNIDFINYVIDNNFKYIISTDANSNSISSLNTLKKYANILIIDHHNCNHGIQLNNVTIINTTMDYSIFRGISAGYYTYILATYVNKEYMQQYHSLAVLSLVSDICYVNNPIVKNAYREYHLAKDHGPLLRSFAKSYTTYNQGFLAMTVAPKLNLMFRLELKDLIYQFATQDDYETLVEPLLAIFKDTRVLKKVFKNIEYKDITNMVVANMNTLPIQESYMSNFTGLIANDLSKRVGKPTLVFSIKNNQAKCSLRCTQGTDLLTTAEHLFLNGGGHRSAYGFSCPLHQLVGIINELNVELTHASKLVLKYFYINNLSDLSFNLYERIAYYNEYVGNGREPIRLLYKVKAEDEILTLSNYTKINASNYVITTFSVDITIGKTLIIIPRYCTTKPPYSFDLLAEEGVIDCEKSIIMGYSN